LPKCVICDKEIDTFIEGFIVDDEGNEYCEPCYQGEVLPTFLNRSQIRDWEESTLTLIKNELRERTEEEKNTIKRVWKRKLTETLHERVDEL